MPDARLADVGLARGVGAVDHISAVIRCGEADRCVAIHVVASEAEVLVTDLLPGPSTRPADVKAHMRRKRRRWWLVEANRDEEVVEVGYRNVGGAQARVAAPGVDVDRRGCDRNRPEQPRRGDPRLEIVLLDPDRVEQINSYEAERSVVVAPIIANIDAAHEPHIAIEAPLTTVTPVGSPLGFGCADDTVEIRDR